MKEQQLKNYEQQPLNKRGLIEAVFNCLKNKYHVWHTRHRSMKNALTHLMAALCAYVIDPLVFSVFKLLPKKPVQLMNF